MRAWKRLSAVADGANAQVLEVIFSLLKDSRPLGTEVEEAVENSVEARGHVEFCGGHAVLWIFYNFLILDFDMCYTRKY